MNFLLHFLISILSLLIFISCDDSDGEQAEIENVKTTLTAMWKAIEKGDMESYATYIHPDFTQFGETDPILRVGKDAELKGISEWLKEAHDIKTEMLEPRVTIKDNVAWIVYYWQDEGKTDTGIFSSRGKSTRIFVKENGHWLCIHGHYTLLPEN